MRRRAARAVVAGVLALALAWVLASGASAQSCEPLQLPPCTTTTTTTTTTTEASTTTTTEASTTTTTQPTATSQPQQQPQQQEQTATTQSRSTTPATQAPTPTTAAPSLLVPGPDPGSVTAATPVDGKKAGVSNEDNTGTVVGLVIGALLLVALIIGLLTYRFWRNTRPATVAGGD